MGNRTSGRGKEGNSVVGHLGEVRRESGGLGGEERRPVDRVFEEMMRVWCRRTRVWR